MMKTLEWPGIATAAALLCAGTITFAIWRDPDGFKLKDWQPLLAACIALGGGALAYKGAMAKVDLDRELADRQVLWDKKAVLIRLQATLLLLRKNAQSSQKFINADAMHSKVGMKLDGLGTPRPELLEEAWGSLGWFPPGIAFKIATIRENLTGLKSALSDHPGGTFSPANVEMILKMFKRVEDHSTTILAWTNPGLKDAEV